MLPRRLRVSGLDGFHSMSGGRQAQKKPSELPSFDGGFVHVVIEAQKGSRIKLKYKPEWGVFVAEKMLPPGMAFPFDFGFIPSMLAEDGDPLDAIVLSESGLPAMSVVLAKVSAILKCRQTEKGKSERNDRVIAIPVDSKSHEPMVPSVRLDAKLIKSISAFFVEYNKLQGKRFEVIRAEGRRQALAAIRQNQQNGRQGRA